MPPVTNQKIDLGTIIKCPWTTVIKDNYTVIPATPAAGILYITENNPSFISGSVRMRGRRNGSYPYNYLEMIDNIYGPERNTIEVCSRSVIGLNNGGNCLTVDINPIIPT